MNYLQLIRFISFQDKGVSIEVANLEGGLEVEYRFAPVELLDDRRRKKLSASTGLVAARGKRHPK
jgi:hypothetical protein